MIGKNVPFALLQETAELPDEALRGGLDRLRAAEFLYETGLFPDLEYAFKHALIHEVTYSTLLNERRRALHAHIVGAIERFYPNRLIENVERLAHHAARGELWGKAVTYFRQAGQKALARSANREAVSCFEQALAAQRHLPETRETLEQAIDLRFDLRAALYPLGEFERIEGRLREAEGLGIRLDDQRRLGQAFVHMCMNLWTTGQPTQALAFGRSARGIAESLGDVPLQATANHHLGVAYLGTGDYPHAEDLVRRALSLLEGNQNQPRLGTVGILSVMARVHLTWISADQGRFSEGVVHGREGIRLAEALDHPYSLAYACWILGYLQTTYGALTSAVGLFERGVALSREWNLSFFSILHTGSLGYAYALSGRVAEGVLLLEQSLSASETMGFGVARSLILAFSGEAYVLADRRQGALEFAGRAVSLAHDRGQRPYEARALRLLGEVTAWHDKLERADRHYHDALALAEELGMRPPVAHCYIGLGNLDRRLGKFDEAQKHLTTATTMYREMDMQFWLEQTAAERKRLP